MKDLGEALAANKKTTEAEVLRQDLECEDNYFTDHIDRSFSALKKHPEKIHRVLRTWGVVFTFIGCFSKVLFILYIFH